jgi:hypothetical protein
MHLHITYSATTKKKGQFSLKNKYPKLHKTGARMEIPLRQYFAQLAQLASVSASLPQNATKLLHLH